MRKIALTICLSTFMGGSAIAQYCDPPGEAAGATTYPVQSSGMATNRTGYDSQGGVHVAWMTGSSIFSRSVLYNFRNESGQWSSSDGFPVNEVTGAGYPTLALTSNDRAAISYHNSSNNYVRLAVDNFRGLGIFNIYDPPDLAPDGNHAIWPQVAISTNGDIHILMVEHTQDVGVYPAMMYTRSTDGGESWTDPVVVASVALLNGCITASPDGKVGIVYLDPVSGGEFSQVKNNVCYFVSPDGRSWDFSTPVCITDYANDNEEIFCPWGIDAVFDNDGNLNAVWVTGHIDDDGVFVDETCQLWHYSETSGIINQIAESTDPELSCMYEAVTLPISMPSVSYSTTVPGALEVIYVGYVDSDASAEGDCVGDLYMTYGVDNGGAWFGPYNITQTHSPGCAAGNCLSENFPSTAEVMADSVALTYVMQKLGDIADTVYYMPVEVPVEIAVEDIGQPPTSFILHGNYPNPFNSRTTIEFELASATNVKLSVFDVTGALVEVLLDDYLEAGKQSVVWNAEDAASGTYFYRLSTSGGSKASRMVLLK